MDVHKTPRQNESIKRILANIEYAHELSKTNQSVKTVIVVSGNEPDKSTWQRRLDITSPYLFNSDGSTAVLSLLERIGNKRKEGNFLGTLLAYTKLKEFAQQKQIPYRQSVTLTGMLFGRGERISPFTQIEGDRKPAIIVSSRSLSGNKYLTAIEEALFYFVPVAKHLETKGFRGILDKWGDETEIASIDLTGSAASTDFANYDVIKFVSTVKITDELAKQKDWVISDAANTLTAVLSRNEKETLVSQLKTLGIKPQAKNEFHAGVSLGPIAVSYDVLDIALEIFDNEIYRDGIYIDFDPYFVMALCTTKENLHLWEEAQKSDRNLKSLLEKVPDFFSKVQRIAEMFKERHGRKMNFKTVDLGDHLFWADIGQHPAMREKYMALNDTGVEGMIARKLEGIETGPDSDGNIIINSKIDKEITVKNSVIMNSELAGRGRIEGSVIKDSVICNPVFKNAFCILSFRRNGKTELDEQSGLYRSIGNDDLALEKGMRHGTLITSLDVYDMNIHETADLRDRDKIYSTPVYDNRISFAEAYDEMFGVSEEDLEERRKKLIEKLAAGS